MSGSFLLAIAHALTDDSEVLRSFEADCVLVPSLHEDDSGPERLPPDEERVRLAPLMTMERAPTWILVLFAAIVIVSVAGASVASVWTGTWLGSSAVAIVGVIAGSLATIRLTAVPAKAVGIATFVWAVAEFGRFALGAAARSRSGAIDAAGFVADCSALAVGVVLLWYVYWRFHAHRQRWENVGLISTVALGATAGYCITQLISVDTGSSVAGHIVRMAPLPIFGALISVTAIACGDQRSPAPLYGVAFSGLFFSYLLNTSSKPFTPFLFPSLGYLIFTLILLFFSLAAGSRPLDRMPLHPSVCSAVIASFVLASLSITMLAPNTVHSDASRLLPALIAIATALVASGMIGWHPTVNTD